MIEGGSISVTGQITGSDVVCFSYFNMVRRWWLLAFVFLLLAFYFIQTLASGEDGAFLRAVPLLLLGAFWGGALIYLPRRTARKVMATQASFREPITWTFSPEAIRVRSCVSESEMKWPVYHKVCETGSCFLMFISSQMTQILPKRFFADPGEQAAWEKLVESQIAPKKIERPGFLAKYL